MHAVRLAHQAGRLALASAFLYSSASAQSLDWVRSPVNAHWYAQSPVHVDWTGAETWARVMGGHLVTVRSQAESDWLAQTFLNSISVTRTPWLGLFQDTNDPNYSEPAGGWKWSSGEPLNFVNWAAGNPNDPAIFENFARFAGPSDPAPDSWLDDNEGAFHDGSDWYIGPGEVVVFNTGLGVINLSQITFIGSSDNIANVTAPVPAIVPNGIVDVDDVYIESGGTLQIEGPNPFTLLASGRIVIRGLVTASGTSSNGVNTLNTTNIPEPGAPGQAGGGRGGTGSPLTNASDPKGGNGYGAFDVPDLGGQGGETGWSVLGGVNARRGAGGGGGVLGRNVLFSGGPLFDQRRIGFDAENGFDNIAGDNGAISGPPGPFGGATGPSPFTDSNPDNDYFGVMFDASANALELGELSQPWAGAGGGAGGDASRVPSGNFPGPWNPQGDEKGSGGAGGGGSVRLIALEHIAFGPNGQVRSRGGIGGGGENTNFLDRVGGGSGGGSGGHVVLESATRIDFSQKVGVVWNTINDNNWAIDVRGGQGGAGSADVGGGSQSPTGQKETAPHQDACPPGYPTGGTNACRGHVEGAGGDGGPGIIQLHTPNGTFGSVNTPGADILMGSAVTIDRLCAPVPLCSDNTTTTPTCHMLEMAGRGPGLFELDSPDCDSDGVPDSYQIAREPTLDSDGNGTLDVCQPAIAYCSTSTTSAGCSPLMGWFGTPSASAASGFSIIVAGYDGQRAGTIFYGLAPTSLPWHSGTTSTLCVSPPTQRTGTQSTGGTAGQCNGQIQLDWNAWRAAHPNALGSPFAAGDTFYAQGWLRDGATPSGNLSNALQFTLAP